jgi:hypothetical protein
MAGNGLRERPEARWATRSGPCAAACFTPGGVYHDGFSDERILKSVRRWAAG